jgi:hypothetical protein
LSEPEFISHHPYPRPIIRRLARTSAVLGLVLIAFGIAAQLLLAVLAAQLRPLLIGTILFSLILTIPFWLQTVLHPEVSVTNDGLVLRPLLWPPQPVAWAQVRAVVPHPLLYEDVLTKRRLHGKGYQPRQGLVIVLSADAPVRWQYRLVGGLSGCGLRRAFAISSTTHRDYAQLVATVREHLAAGEAGVGA